MFEGQFGEVTGGTRPLDFLVSTDTFQRAAGSHKFAFSAEIALTQDKLHQIAHGYGIHWFYYRRRDHGCCDGSSANNQTSAGSLGAL